MTAGLLDVLEVKCAPITFAPSFRSMATSQASLKNTFHRPESAHAKFIAYEEFLHNGFQIEVPGGVRWTAHLPHVGRGHAMPAFA